MYETCSKGQILVKQGLKWIKNGINWSIMVEVCYIGQNWSKNTGFVSTWFMITPLNGVEITIIHFSAACVKISCPSKVGHQKLPLVIVFEFFSLQKIIKVMRSKCNATSEISHNKGFISPNFDQGFT